ncbi:ABC transporter ATP-binding protein [Listeria riparia FSL S10-1204]|uniref:ABC transporter ATP-binding protein n=1 Tax=Listeria riparia FSL S10-1204 TaxID=1265816 RepID=W7DAI5_9LIST|nr:ABC transporter ATP-binding protein [Listeria riparia FSL S10-1204]
MTKILEFTDVTYSYNQSDNPILDNINYTFATGVFYTVVGSSGSGKTTFLSLAGGLDAPKGGDIFYKGLSLKKIGLNRYRNQYVSIVFQSYNLLTYMTALQNVTTAMEITHVNQKDKKQFALDMLAKVGIDEKNGSPKSTNIEWRPATTRFHRPSIVLRNRFNRSRRTNRKPR